MTHEEIMAYIEKFDPPADSNATPVPLDLRGCEFGVTRDQMDGPWQTTFLRARVRVPRSGWALKKFPGVRDWVNDKSKKFGELRSKYTDT